MFTGMLYNRKSWQWFMAYVCPTWLWRGTMWLRFDFKYWIRGIKRLEPEEYCPECAKIAGLDKPVEMV